MKIYSTKKIILGLIWMVIVPIVIFFVVWGWFFAKEYLEYSSYEKEKVFIKGATFVSYVADSEEKRKQGLGGKKTLPVNKAMLFKFDKPDIYGIWMKDMFFPIDIIWLDKNKEIVNLKENVDPSTFPLVYYPPKESLYVLEFRAGIVKNNDLKIGDKILFDE